MEQVKKGYKRTELGTIPQDWTTGNIDTLVVNGGLIRGPFGGALKKECFVPSGYKVYEQKNAIYKSVEIGDYYVDAFKFKELKRFEVNYNDFILSCSGTIGRIYRIPKLFQRGIINQALLIMRLDSTRILHEYFYYQFTNETFQKKVIDDTQGGAMKNLIGMSDFRKVEMPLPPTLTEQKAIATALSDVDELITKLEKLIEKKKAIKQGAMQQLLTPPHKGGKRLEGYSGEWVEVLLGKLANVNMGQSPLSENYNFNGMGLPLIQGNADVKNRKTIIRTFTSQITKRGEIGDIVMSVRAPVGEISKATIQCCLGRGVCAIRYKNDYVYHYLVYFEKSWAKLSSGSTFDSVNSKQVNELPIPIPSNEKEQVAISQILNEMDFEIEAVELSLNKVTLLKQGMMQELLTGNTRLI